MASRKPTGDPPAKRVRWTAELDHVREVSLFGGADLSYWQSRLAKEDLIPVEKDGRAQILIIASCGKFKGLNFSELSISALTSPPRNAAAEQSCCLIRAYNSNRFFAFCERVLFSTPYEHADVIVELNPARIRVTQRERSLFQAEMHFDSRASDGDSTQQQGKAWIGQIFLPRASNSSSGADKMFFARVGGAAEPFPFVEDSDLCQLTAPSHSNVFCQLLESNFVARQWLIRSDAQHAKSKTYRRGAVVDLGSR